jgi:AraC-like DNA-binding protein
LSLCVVAQGRKRVRIGSVEYFYDPLHYLVMTRGIRFQADILEASRAKPFLSFVLEVGPEVVTEVLSAMHRQMPALFRMKPAPTTPSAYVTPLDQNLMGAVQRFLQSLDSHADRTVLAPMYLREIVYRLLGSEQRHRLVRSAMMESETNPIAASVRIMKTQIARPLTVAELAESACMSQSGFAHLFKETTGVSPYQFLKQLRLEHARKLLLDGRNVSSAASEVGYSSLSHFIEEFRRYFGETPGNYHEQLRRHAVAKESVDR